jgi:hypothetical protein
MRSVLIAKRSGREARITCLNQLRRLGFCGSDDRREAFRGVPRKALAARAAGLRRRAGSDDVTYATKPAMRTLGRWVLAIETDNTELDTLLADLVETTAGGLLAVQGVGVDTAAILLVAAGDNADRIRRRGGVGAPVRCRTGTRVIGEDHPPSTQPGREPSSQPRAVADRVHPPGIRSSQPRVRRAPPQRGTLQARDHPRAGAAARLARQRVVMSAPNEHFDGCSRRRAAATPRARAPSTRTRRGRAQPGRGPSPAAASRSARSGLGEREPRSPGGEARHRACRRSHGRRSARRWHGTGPAGG